MEEDVGTTTKATRDSMADISGQARDRDTMERSKRRQ